MICFVNQVCFKTYKELDWITFGKLFRILIFLVFSAQQCMLFKVANLYTYFCMINFEVGFFGGTCMCTHIKEREWRLFSTELFQQELFALEKKPKTTRNLNQSVYNRNANSQFHFNSQVNCFITSLCEVQVHTLALWKIPHAPLSLQLAIFLKGKIESFSHCTKVKNL